MRPEVTLTHNGTDYTINLDYRTPDDGNGPGDVDKSKFKKSQYIHYHEEFNLYFLISYKTRNTDLLDITVHDYGAHPTIERIDTDEFDRETIRDSVETNAGIRLSDDQLDMAIDFYVENGYTLLSEAAANEHDWEEYIYSNTDTDGIVGYTNHQSSALIGWDYLFEQDEFENIDPSEIAANGQDVDKVIFEAVRKEAPNCYNFSEHGHEPEYVARLEFPEPEDWQLRALELYQYSVLNSAPELAKTQALREQGLSQSEIGNKLGKHRSTVSRQFDELDEKWPRVAWTAENVKEMT